MTQRIHSKIAIIPARGGSKRIPSKNIKTFCGKPIIEYSLCAALQSGLFDEVMVSTDDDQIADIALKSGAKVPFKRSARNSDDFATTSDVLLEVITQYLKAEQQFEYICCIYPTAVFVNADTLIRTYNLIIEEDLDSIIPVVKFSYPIQRGLLKDKAGLMSYREPEFTKTRSQDIIPVYHDAGQFYWLNTKAFLQQKDLVMAKTASYEVSEMEVQDIDCQTDWQIAELKYKLLSSRM